MSRTSRKFAVLIAACGLSALTSGIQAAEPTGAKDFYGTSAALEVANREIVVTSSTKWVNVTNGETVRFSIEGKSFAWHFDTWRDADSFNLNAIAPKEVKAPNIQVYVARNPVYSG